MHRLKTAVLSLLLCSVSWAGMEGINISATTLALASSTQQGGQGPQGTTILTQGDLVYNTSWYGIGGFYFFDIQGSSEKDHSVGPKLELHYGPFYVEGGYAILVRRDFTDRSIAYQRGNGWFVGLGVRFGLESPDTGWFFQASYKLRVQTLTQQDGVTLDQSIRIQDTYPLVGLGINF